MTEEEARLALLQNELNALQKGITGLDSITFQIKGWCVTVSLAIGGFAIAYHRAALLFVGAAAVLGFYLVNCQFKLIQRAFMERNDAINHELVIRGIMPVLKGETSFPIVGTGGVTPFLFGADTLRKRLHRLWNQALQPDTFSLYLFILICLGVEAFLV